jgi:hypothetical protein
MITFQTADALEALALKIFDPTVTPSTNPSQGATWGAGTGLTGPDATIDAELYSLIKEVAQTIDGRIIAPGFKYTLNVTNALQLRPKKWYLKGIMELDGSGYGWPCCVAMEYIPKPGLVQGGTNSFGGTLGLAACACIAHTWANIIRRWLQGQYLTAVTQPSVITSPS